MNQSPDIISAEEVNGIYRVSYIRPDDKKEFTYRVTAVAGRVVWGNWDGRWRDDQYDELILYTIEGNKLTIDQTFTDGSKLSETFDMKE